ncbi:MAG: hypothetical protein SFY95_10885 [Planctomycetota bacterium]|nr:hypothetical protein [Planctomycetota bacterium]
MHRNAGRSRPKLIVLLCALASLVACTEERVVRSRPAFAGLPGATGAQIIDEERDKRLAESGLAPSADQQPEREVVNPDGTRTLLTRNVRDLMFHVASTLQKNERDLLVGQLLSRTTIAEFVERGLDPALAFDLLKSMEPDIRELFSKLPGGELTPGSIMQPLPGRAVRLRLPIEVAGRDRLIGFDVIPERAQWKLRWFVPGPEYILPQP